MIDKRIVNFFINSFFISSIDDFHFSMDALKDFDSKVTPIFRSRIKTDLICFDDDCLPFISLDGKDITKAVWDAAKKRVWR